VLAVILIGGLIWLFSPGAGGEVVAPEHETLGAGDLMESGTTADGRPYLGASDAPVAVVEFADFQCPHCKEFAEDYAAEIAGDYLTTGDVRLEWVSVTFTGSESTEAAKAGVCAAEQGKFWPLHDWLFANQGTIANAGSFSRERVLEMASGAGLDVTELEACLDDPATEDAVREGAAVATELGIVNTPSFVIGDTVVSGTDIDALREAIDDALDG